MTRTKTLRARYGKLTVLSDKRLYSRWIVTVRCTCGTEKEVQAESLMDGRTKSCGAQQCKLGKKVKFDKNYHPRGPVGVSLDMVKVLWRSHEEGRSAAHISAMLSDERTTFNVNTLGSLFRSIRRCGGIDQYIKLVQAGKP